MASLSFDPTDHLDEVETEALIRELRKRRAAAVDDFAGAFFDELRADIAAGRNADALLLLDRLQFPKWRQPLQQAARLFA